MTTFRFLFVALLLCLSTPYLAYNQTEDRKGEKKKEQQEQPCRETHASEAQTIQVFVGKELQSMQEIDRAVLEIEFNRLIDEIDLLYHTPPQFKKHPLPYFGYQDKENRPTKGDQ